VTLSPTFLVVLAAARPSREWALGVSVPGGPFKLLESPSRLTSKGFISGTHALRVSTPPSERLSSGPHDPQLPHRFPIRGALPDHAGGCRAAA